MEYIMNWDELFIRQAMLIAQKSKDPSTKVGCVIVGQDNVVLSMGFNGFPRGVIEQVDIQVENYPAYIKELHPTRWQRPEKYSWIEHSERNAIFNAARHGIRLDGARAYLNWEPQPCADCTRALIQSGIKEIIGPNIPFKGAGAGVNYHIDFANQMCKEAGVKITYVEWNHSNL
jgi:dCMP deaminase